MESLQVEQFLMPHKPKHRDLDGIKAFVSTCCLWHFYICWQASFPCSFDSHSGIFTILLQQGAKQLFVKKFIISPAETPLGLATYL